MSDHLGCEECATSTRTEAEEHAEEALVGVLLCERGERSFDVTEGVTAFGDAIFAAGSGR